MIALPPKKVSSILRDLPGINQSRHSDSSVVQLCLILCDPMNYSTPGLPSITNSQSSPKLRSIKLVMPSNYLILYRPLLLLPSIFSSIRVFSKESVLHIRWPKYQSFSMSPSSEYSGLISPTVMCKRGERLMKIIFKRMLILYLNKF